MQPNQVYINHHSSIVNQQENAESHMNEIEEISGWQSAIQTGKVGMRAPTSSEELLKKIKLFDCSGFISRSRVAQSQTKMYKEISLYQGCQYLPEHAFSIEYWNDFDKNTHEEKENKIQTFINTCLDEFKDEMGDETKQSFSLQGDFTKYLLSMKDESHFSSLMKECAQHYALLEKSKNRDLKERLLVQFPPKAEDLACIPGTRTRLQSATQELKRAEGLLDPLDEMIQQGIQRQLNQILIDHKLSHYVYPGNEIHLQPYFHHLLGVSEETVKEKDQFFSLPQSEITAKSVHDFLSTLETTVSKTIKDILKEKITDFSNQLSHIEKSGFLSGLLDDLKNGSFVQFIKSISRSFDLSGSNYKEAILDDNEEETTEYRWNESDLYSDIFNHLSTIENKKPKNNLYFDYKDAFNSKKQIDIISFLKSDNIEKLESAINLLFVLGGPYKGSSPIEFFNTLLKLSPNNNSSYDLKISRCWILLAELKIKCEFNPALHHLLEKISSIKNNLECYLIDNPDEKKNIQHYIRFLNNDLDLSVKDNFMYLLNTFILCNSSVETFRFFIGNDINKINVSDISDLISYSADRKELLEFFNPSMTQESIILLFKKAMDKNDDQMICDVFDYIGASNFDFIAHEFNQTFSELVYYCVNNRKFDLAEKYLILPDISVYFFGKEDLFFLVKSSVSSGKLSILNKVIKNVSKETFFGLENRTWVKIICDFIENSEKLSLEALAQSYFDSDIKTMLLSIKESQELGDIETISGAIESACLDHSTRILDILLQSGCTIDEILFLASQGDNLPFIDKLYSNNIFNSYSITTKKMKNNLFKKRDDTVMWLMDKGCPLSHFQKVLDTDNNGSSFIYHCAKRLEFELLSKMLQKTENYTDFMSLPTQRSEHLLFIAAKAGSKAKGELKTFLLNFILTALDHPARTETLNQAHYSRGLTPLHYALSRGDIDLLTILLEDKYLTLDAIGAKSTGEHAGHTAMKLAKMALSQEAPNRAEIQTCLEMLENKKQQLIMQNLNVQNSRKRLFSAIENQPHI